MRVDLLHRLNYIGSFSAVTNFALLQEDNDNWDRFSLLSDAEGLRGTTTNFSVRRRLIIDMVREARHNMGDRSTMNNGNSKYRRVLVRRGE